MGLAGVPISVSAASASALDPRFTYSHGADAAAENCTGAVVTLHGLPDGKYQARWWDTRAGRDLGTTTAASKNGILPLPVVPFRVDTAARVVPVP